MNNRLIMIVVSIIGMVVVAPVELTATGSIEDRSVIVELGEITITTETITSGINRATLVFTTNPANGGDVVSYTVVYTHTDQWAHSGLTGVLTVLYTDGTTFKQHARVGDVSEFAHETGEFKGVETIYITE